MLRLNGIKPQTRNAFGADAAIEGDPGPGPEIFIREAFGRLIRSTHGRLVALLRRPAPGPFV